MANQKLFLSEETKEFKTVGNSMSTNYRFIGDELVIKWYGIAKKFKANLGDALLIKCNGGFPEILPLRSPRSRGQKLLWLCGFSSYNRANCLAKFEEKLPAWNESFNWWNFRTWETNTQNAKLVLCSRPDCGGVYHYASYARDEIENSEIKEIVENFWGMCRIYFPKEFVENFCKKEFGIKVNL